MNQRDRQILQIALPAIVSNITVPLLGLVDVTIVGHLGAPAYIGAIAVGGMLFNIICWIFSFLRMGTSGMTSQAYGKRDLPEVMRLLVRSTGIGLAVGVGFVVLQTPVRQIAFALVQPTEEVRALTALYFDICIWSVPAMLGLYGLTGWFIGMQNSRIPMVIAITQNVVNIAASLCLVFLCGMKVEGVATGTLIAQYAGLLTGLLLWWRHYGRLKKHLHDGSRSGTGIWERSAMVRFFTVNRDIFLRTLCLVAVTMFFTSAGAAQGEIILAVNTLMMQFFMLFSFVMDGFAYAGEALSGRFIGARNREAFADTLRRLFMWGALMTLLFTVVYAAGGSAIIGLLTNEAEVIAASGDYFHWVLLIPVAGITAFIWDSIFIGATATRGMLLSMAVAAASFFALYYGLRPTLANHALWVAFLTYLFLRGAVQTGLARGVIKNSF